MLITWRMGAVCLRFVLTLYTTDQHTLSHTDPSNVTSLADTLEPEPAQLLPSRHVHPGERVSPPEVTLVSEVADSRLPGHFVTTTKFVYLIILCSLSEYAMFISLASHRSQLHG